jgi:hypothetical protein
MKVRREERLAKMILSGESMPLMCRVDGCQRTAKVWVLWDSANPGDVPNQVKTPVCVTHKRYLRSGGAPFTRLGRVKPGDRM